MAIQGVGKVGATLAGFLGGEGCEVVVGDVVAEAAETVAAPSRATVVSADGVP